MESVQVVSEKHMESMSAALRVLYAEEHLSDVTIYCKEGRLRAHKLILAASSSYFFKIFKENRHDYPIIVLNGVSMGQLKNLIDLLYTGTVYVPNDNVDVLAKLIEEFEIKGVKFGEQHTNNIKIELNPLTSTDSSRNIDTRFKGQKRVAVDFSYDRDNAKPAHNYQEGDHRETSMSPVGIKAEPVSSDDVSPSDVEHRAKEGPKLNAWARKQRKFKCHLCPSSFKRSSHLSRHQLVHTGERPYSCEHCDKAFSRHDKLKHHVRKAHEFVPDSMYERIDEEVDDESHVQQEASSRSNNGETRPRSPLFTISHISSILEDSFVTPPKKARGRPRKNPPPLTTPPAVVVKRGPGRPRNCYPGVKSQNYDITNLPYGDLNYLTEERSPPMNEDPQILEPLVEISMDQGENAKSDPLNDRPPEQDDVNISEIEQKISLIGECTISVAN